MKPLKNPIGKLYYATPQCCLFFISKYYCLRTFDSDQRLVLIDFSWADPPEKLGWYEVK